MLGDAEALFGSVIHFLRTGRQTSSEDRQANQTSQWHVARSRLGVPEPAASGPGLATHVTTIGRRNSFGKIVFKLGARDRRPKVIGELSNQYA
jgi:hypothetical protein